MLHRLRGGIRRIIQPVLWLGYRRYLQKSRWYTYKGLHINVQPSVFHPGMLFSTKILLQYILQLDLKGKKVLELGAGSGMLALAAARAGATVSASDINPAAIESIKASCQKNQLEIDVILSDLFESIPQQAFDYLFINPPYYPKDPTDEREYAFFCGSEFEYFQRLFASLADYLSPTGAALMILSDDCDVERIKAMALKAGWKMPLQHQTKKWGEVNYIFQISA